MISREEVQGLAALARLKVSDQEVENLQKDISNILEYVGQISAVSADTTGTPEVPLNHNVLREDVVRGEDDPMAGKEESVRKEFPRREGDYLAVQKILQKDE
jgi:aspartyl-tRNA(Asn)/glutamyl-tRNA(Gln) amidotransferase subunit C